MTTKRDVQQFSSDLQSLKGIDIGGLQYAVFKNKKKLKAYQHDQEEFIKENQPERLKELDKVRIDLMRKSTSNKAYQNKLKNWPEYGEYLDLMTQYNNSEFIKDYLDQPSDFEVYSYNLRKTDLDEIKLDDDNIFSALEFMCPNFDQVMQEIFEEKSTEEKKKPAQKKR